MPDIAWYDASGATAQAMINQTEYPFEDERQHHRREQPRGQGGLRHDHGQRRRGPLDQAPPVERGLGGVVPERRLRHDGLPRLDARCHRGQRRRRRGLGHRQRLPRRRRQLGRLLPHRARAVRAPRGGQGARRVADRARAADQGLRGQGHLPEPGRRAGRADGPRAPPTPSSTTPRPARSCRTGRRPCRSARTRVPSSPTSSGLPAGDPAGGRGQQNSADEAWDTFLERRGRRLPDRHPDDPRRPTPPPGALATAALPAAAGTHPSGHPTATPAPPRLTWRQRLCRWDAKSSPYLFISPFFLLFLLIGHLPAGLHGLRLGPRLEPARRQGRVRRPRELPRRPGRPLLLERPAQHHQHLPALLGAPGPDRPRGGRAARQPAPRPAPCGG